MADPLPASANATNMLLSASTSTPREQLPPCWLLDLPPELRNRIYEFLWAKPVQFLWKDPEQLAVTCPRPRYYEDWWGDNKITLPCYLDQYDCACNLINATPPEYAILRTCRQIIKEATTMYKAARQAYWSSSHFAIKGVSNRPGNVNTAYTEMKAFIQSMSDQDIASIKQLTVYSAESIVQWWQMSDRVWVATWLHSHYGPIEETGFIVTPSDKPHRLASSTSLHTPDGSKWADAIAVKSYGNADAKQVDYLKELYGGSSLTKNELRAVFELCASGYDVTRT